MVEGAGAGPADERAMLAGAYREARALIDAAQREAERLVAEAGREARRREREADLLVAKARRLLVAAEERAAVIVATAQELTVVIDLDAELDGLRRVVSARGGALRASVPTRIDGMLASAIGHAVDEAFPADVAT